MNARIVRWGIAGRDRCCSKSVNRLAIKSDLRMLEAFVREDDAQNKSASTINDASAVAKKTADT